MNRVKDNSDQMRDALAAIADEMQKLQNDSISSSHEDAVDDEEAFQELVKCKISLKSKKEELKRIKEQLKMACYIAKTLSTAKEKESASLNNQVNFARTQYLDVVKQNKEETEILNKITKENINLRDNLEHFTHSIDLGYAQLQKVRNEEVKGISSLTKLKEIILCCGQFYADYCNEHNKRMRLEQRNRFLTNKIRILECNLGVPQDLFLNHKRKENALKKEENRNGRSKSRECVNIGVVCSEYQVCKNKGKLSNLTMTKIEVTKSREFNLKSHLDLVQRLLLDQDSLLNDLKCLSDEILEESI